MHGQVAVVQARSVQQRWVAAVGFGLTLLIAGALVKWTIRRYIVGPIARVNAELTAAKDKAEEASPAKSEFDRYSNGGGEALAAMALAWGRHSGSKPASSWLSSSPAINLPVSSARKADGSGLAVRMATPCVFTLTCT